MKHYAVVLLALAAVLGAAATAPLPLDQRLTIAAAIVVLGAVLRISGGSGALRALVLLALVGGAVNASRQRDHEPAVRERPIATYTGIVLGDEQSNGPSGADYPRSFSFVYALDTGPRVLVSAFGQLPPIGSHILVRGRLEPFDDARNPGEPSQRKIEQERGLLAHIAVARIVGFLPQDSGFRLDIVLARAHAWALQQLRTYLPEPQASVVAGELWGERSALPSELHDEFQETGTVHILVTAGLHLGVVAALIVSLLQLLRAPRVVACTIAIACAWGYACFSGMHEPAMRAATMLTFALAARACGRKSLSWNALGAAGLVFALLRPLEVTGASFALSFSCVGAIFVVADPVTHWLDAQWQHLYGWIMVRHKELHEHVDAGTANHISDVGIASHIKEAIALAIATQIGTWPLTAAIFLQFSPYAIVANILIVPVVGCTMLLAGAQFAVASLAPIAQAFANVNGWCLTWMLFVIHLMATLPHARIVMTPAPMWCIVMYDVALLLAPWLWKRFFFTRIFGLFKSRHRKFFRFLHRGDQSDKNVISKGNAYICIAPLIVATCLVLWPPRLSDHRLRITALDVGQADALIIQTPAGHTMLVDTGGQLERNMENGASNAERVGERTVLPFLLRQGIHAVDTILITHPHGDHVGGCAPILRTLPVGEVADSGQQYGGNAYHDCIDTARRKHVSIVYPQAGMVWKTDDGITLFFVGPQVPFLKDTGNDVNDNSIAFILQYKHFRMFFTGDAGFAAEQRFLHLPRIRQRFVYPLRGQQHLGAQQHSLHVISTEYSVAIPSEAPKARSRGTAADTGNREDLLSDLHADVLKVGHHGSAYSSSPEFLAAVHPRYAIISVGRYNHFGHPAPRTLLALLRIHAKIYRTDQNAAVTIMTDGNATSLKPMITVIYRSPCCHGQ